MCLGSIYNSYWAGCGDMKFMTDVLIVVSQRPLDFTAIGCLKVKMEMFAKVSATFYVLIMKIFLSIIKFRSKIFFF